MILKFESEGTIALLNLFFSYVTRQTVKDPDSYRGG